MITSCDLKSRTQHTDKSKVRERNNSKYKDAYDSFDDFNKYPWPTDTNEN